MAKSKSGKGGKRAGAGRPKGSKAPQTLAREHTAAILAQDKLSARLALQELVFTELAPLVQAQIANAKGLRYLVTRDTKSGKFVRVTEAMARVQHETVQPDALDAAIERLLKKADKLPKGVEPVLRSVLEDRRLLRTEMLTRAGREETIEVWEKDPNVGAFNDLMNRALDKPAEQPKEIKLTGELAIVDRLNAARQRLAKAS